MRVKSSSIAAEGILGSQRAALWVQRPALWGRTFSGLILAIVAMSPSIERAWGEQPPTSVAGVAAATAPAAAKPGPNDRQITLAVRSYLEREHFTRRPIDDEIARRWFDIFLEALDPMKIYFLQSDIDGFLQRRDTLDDLVKRGDVSFAYEATTGSWSGSTPGCHSSRSSCQRRRISRSRNRSSSTATTPSGRRARPRPKTTGASGSNTTCWCRRWKRRPPRRRRTSCGGAMPASPNACIR